MRWRMKDPFEGATLLAPKIRAYWDLCRPFTLLAPFIGGILFGAMALMATDGVRLNLNTFFQIFYAAVTLAALNAGSNAINQASDAEIDAINKPYRPVPSGIVSRPEADSIGMLLWGAVLIRAMFVNWAFIVGIMIIMFLSWHYSAGAELKRRYVWNNLSIAISRGFFGPWAAWSVIGNPDDPAIIFICLTLFVYTFGATVFKDLPDVAGDKAYGVRNFVTVNGAAKAVNIGVCFMLLSHVVVLVGTISGLLPTGAGGYHLNVVITMLIWYLASSESDKDSAIENRWSWVLMYLQMLLIMLLFTGVFLYG